MKKLQRFLSAVLCIVMIAAMAIPAAASAAPTASKLSVNDILKDFDKDDYTVVEFGEGGKFSLAEFQAGTGVVAKHTVYEGVKATQLVAQNISWASYAKNHIAFGNNVNAFKEYGYMVVKYASVSDKAYSLSVGGWGSMESGVTFTVPAGKTGWTTSEVLTVSPACAAVATTKRHIASSYAAETYIGDIVFFKNKADAEEYAKWAPIYLDPNGDATLRRIQKREENWETIKLIMMLVGSSIADRMALKPPSIIQPLEGLEKGEYYIFKCDRVSLAPFNNDTVIAGSFATYNDVNALKLGAQSIWARAKANATFGNPGLPQTYRYAVFRYASESDNEYELGIGWDYFDVDGKYTKFTVPAGKTDWTLSDPIAIAGTSLKGASKLALASSSPTADTYVADIVLFNTKDDAKQYIKQWNDYYAGVYNPMPNRFEDCDGGYTLHTLIEKNFGDGRYGYDENTFTNNGSTQAPNGIAAEYTTYLGVECIKPVYNKSWANVNGTAGGYGVALNNLYEINTANRKYGVITYASTAEHQLEFNITWANNGVIGSNPNTDGWMSTCFEIEPGTMIRESTRANTGVYSADPFYLREIVFFETKADAEAYAAKAPAYFNGEEYNENVVIPSHPANFTAKNSYTRYAITADKVGNFKGGHEAWSGSPTFAYSTSGLYYGTVLNKNASVAYLSGYTTDGKSPNVTWDRAATSGIRFVLRGIPEIDAKYMVIGYSSDSSAAHQLGLWAVNNGYRSYELAKVKANAKGWATTAPIDLVAMQTALNKDDGTASNIINSMRTREIALFSNAPDKASLNITEILFFSNYDDAKACADALPAYYNAIDNQDWFVRFSSECKGNVSILPFVSGGAYSQDGDTTSTDITLHTESNRYALEIKHGGDNWYNSTYRFAYYAKERPITSDYKYAVATFATDIEDSVAFKIKHWNAIDLVNGAWVTNPNAPSDTTLCDDISVSDGKWVTSSIVNVTPEWAYRTGTAKLALYLATKSTTNLGSFYVHSIAYFTNREDAEAYVKAAPAYFNGEPNYNPDYWLSVLGEGEMLTQEYVNGNYTLRENSTIVKQDATFGRRNVDCAEVSYQSISFPRATYSLSAAGSSAFRSAINASEYKYAVMTYATKTETPAALTVKHWKFVSDGVGGQTQDDTLPEDTVLIADISVSDGKWTTSDIVEVGPNWRWRASRDKIIYFANSTDEDNPIYIREIRFFTSEDDAKLYQSLAPDYYNNHYGK